MHGSRAPSSARLVVHVFLALLTLAPLGSPTALQAQDGSTALNGVVEDITGARIPSATVTVVNPANGFLRHTMTDASGYFSFRMLLPGRYDVQASAPGMAAQTRAGIELYVGGVEQVQLRLAPAGRTETVTVRGQSEAVETQGSAVSHVIPQRAIADLPLNGRRFTDLALLTPGVTQDPRGLTSDSNGDLSVGGTRGFQNTFLVDGADYNNSFFAQARGRYRAPYQFSNEVIQEFRVSSNSYSAELGRAGGAVFNVVTKSGSNNWHGSSFYYLRDSILDAQQPYATCKPDDRRQQFGGTFGGPIRKDRAFFYAGFDQHLLNVPSIMQFSNGASLVVPQPADYDYKDRQLVFAAAQQLNTMAGIYPTTMRGNAAFGKLDYNFSQKQLAFLRVNTSRLTGTNNVFFDPSSPMTSYAQSANGTENVKTESVAASLVSAWTSKLATNLRAQYSRDVQQSTSNSDQPWTKIYNLVAGFGGSSILPRETREHKLHIADTLSYETRRVQWKFGGDFLQAWIYNYYPGLFGGEYYFDNVKVDPFTFLPMKHGEPLTPLSAYAHVVPRYYMQNFGTAISHPNSRSYAAFMQDTFRITRSLTLNAGIRYDLQTFQAGDLVSNPLYPPAGRIPTLSHNVSPRVGFAFSIGDRRPLMVRGGAGIFYMQIPGIYASQVANDNGVSQSQLFLDNMNAAQAAVFPKYPVPLVNCAGAAVCTPPASVAALLTAKVSAFSPHFQTPYTEQANLTVERELGRKFIFSASYLYVHGEHLLRSLDANLPKPTILEYPVYNDASAFMGMYDVASFATWQTTPSVDCPYPPCINDVQRPNPRLGIINSFQSEASSLYNGLTISLRRQTSRGLFLRVGYTFASALDDGPDALVVGRPGNVQNAYAITQEKSRSVDEQRNRFVAAAVFEPKQLHFRSAFVDKLVNHWKFSSVMTIGSGRPLNATMAGDANRDDNTYNDRLPGYRRNAFTGPGYFTTDLRIARSLQIAEHAKLEFLGESFNLFNRSNNRVNISDDGFYNSAGQFVAYSATAKGKTYPGQFQANSKFLKATNAYAPRQVQLAIRLNF
jgi:Carboxypeptidase regulatory-like domain/TonB dependent receptor-like, beta-barrel